MSPRKKIAFKLAVIVTLMGVVLYNCDIGQVFVSIIKIPMEVILILVVLVFIAVYINSYKWKILIGKYTVVRLFALNLIAQFYAIALPGQIMGDAAKTVILVNDEGDGASIVASVIMDKLLGLLSLLVVGGFGIIYTVSVYAVHLRIYYLLAVMAVFLLIFLVRIKFFYALCYKWLDFLGEKFKIFKSVCDKCNEFIKIWSEYANRNKLIILALMYGVIYQLLNVLMTYIIAKYLNVEISIIDWCWILGIVSVFMLIPLSIGGIGIREMSLIGILNFMGVTTEKALSISLILYFLTICLAIVGAIIEVTGVHRIKTTGGSA